MLLVQGPHKTKHIVILTASIWVKRYKAKSTKGKGTCGTVWSFQESYPSPIPEPTISFQTGVASNFQESYPSGITQGTLNSCRNKLWQNMSNTSLPGKLIRDSSPRVLIESWSQRHPLSDTYQHPRLPGGKRQAFSIHHTASHSSQFREWWGMSQNSRSQMCT